MRTLIEQALGQIESLVDASQPFPKTTLIELDETLAAIQAEYLDTIKRSLSLLVTNQEDDSYALLAGQRDALEPVREQIGMLVAAERHGSDPYIKQVIEYLFTRARLVEELKMFPDFGLQLLERLTLEQSLEETIYYLESAMTGKRQLYENMRAAHEALLTGR
ncbi:MAG TPA: hypothetical protein VJ998_07220 [Pseudomonadales bacterium]|nr:hypothetical protein [Pseudomonadales bacterium]